MSAYDRRTFVKQSALLAGAAAAGCLLPAPTFGQDTSTGKTHPFFQNMNRPEVIAHRGGAGQWPEETLYALRQAVEAGADIVEIDVHSTCDGELVLMHDDEVGRTTGREGCVKDYAFSKEAVGGGACKDAHGTVSDLDAGHGWPYCCKPRPVLDKLAKDCGQPRRLFKRTFEECCTTHPFRAAGHKVPTLKEALDEFAKQGSRPRLIVEIKESNPSAARSFCDTVDAYAKVYEGLKDRILVASFYDTTLDAVRADSRCEKMARSAATCESLKLTGTLSTRLFLNLLGSAISCSAIKEVVRFLLGGEKPPPGLPHAIQVPGKLISDDKDFVRRAHDRNLIVHAWTINDPAQMWEMMDAGVDGIITDYPSHLIDYRRRWRESPKRR